MANDQLGKRMKEQYESRTRTWLPRRTYTIIRLDGKAFHTYTRGMKRPYDEGLMRVMDRTTKFLCEEIQGCKFAYTQSDEISLLLTDFETITTEAWFDGQVQKIVSVAASMATGKFNQEMLGEIIFSPDVDVADTIFTMASQPLAFFDARAFTIPDPIEVENYFIWRQKDAVRNSLSMHAQSLYSHKELHGKSQADMHDMIHDAGENWDDLPNGFKRGRSFLKREGSWVLECPDFLKDRDVFRSWIPKITYE
jgi:tRNA(His) guanylyltransferase